MTPEAATRAELAQAIQERDEARAERDRMAKDLADLRQHMLTAVKTTAITFNRYVQIEALAVRLFGAMDRDDDASVEEMADLIGELRPLLKTSPAPPTNVEPR